VPAIHRSFLNAIAPKRGGGKGLIEWAQAGEPSPADTDQALFLETMQHSRAPAASPTKTALLRRPTASVLPPRSKDCGA
jgi:hypothetical protein